MRFSPGGDGKPPIAVLDLRSATLGLDLAALMVWPKDPVRRQQWGAAHTTLAIENLEEPPEHLAANDQRLAQVEADKTGRPAQEILEEWQKHFQAKWKGELREIGGATTVVNAPALATMYADLRIAAAGGARRAGELLFLIASMEEHHRELQPSLNRAMAVLEARYQKTSVRSTSPRTNERALKDAWRDWRHVAPLWAGLVFFEHAAKKIGELPDPFLNPQTGLLMLSTAAWYRNFATTYQPRRSPEVLIPDAECLRLDCGIDPGKPALFRFPKHLLEVARRYSVKAVKQY